MLIRYLLITAIFFVGMFKGMSQEQYAKDIDSLYKEDQFYAGVTYNLLGKKPNDISQSGFSLGFHLGFIKDMPINKRRNVALGLGLGYSANSFIQNLLISEGSDQTTAYSVLSNTGTFSKNKFSNHLIEMPFEFRWRSSTASSYNFWRIYTGFKVGYVIRHTAKYKGDLGDFKHDGEDFNKFQYGLTFSLGYNTWNLHIYYGLNNIFSKDAILNDELIDMKAVKLGLMFYIL